MSAQIVLLPVFVLVGLTFVLLLMAGRRQGAVVGGEARIKDIASGQFDGLQFQKLEDQMCGVPFWRR